MLTSIAIILLMGLILDWVFTKLKLPGLLGMIIIGIILGPHALNIIDPSIISISPDLRQAALIMILTRAGLSLKTDDLKQVGRPAVLMSFLPATVEIIGTIILAPPLLGVSVLEAAIIGTVIAAVSPAVVVPGMLKIMDKGYGMDKNIPQLILAGASVDDVFVIVLFSALTELASTGGFSPAALLTVPISIALGILLGAAAGFIFSVFFKKFHMRDSVKIIILLSVSFLMVELEHRLDGIIPLSGLLAVMSMGITVNRLYGILAVRLSQKYNKLWIAAQIFLFVLVGAEVNISDALQSGIFPLLLILGALIFRMGGVALSLIKTPLNKKERLFCMAAYTPKATVQAAIGSVPLAMGLPCGSIVLTAAVTAIIITAPFGAICIDRLHEKLLTKAQPE